MLGLKIIKGTSLLVLFLFLFTFTAVAFSHTTKKNVVKIPSKPNKLSVGWKPKINKLKVYKGPLTITKKGTIVDGVQINGALLIEADNVKITRSLIVSPTIFYVVRQWTQFKNFQMSYVEITAAKGAHPDIAFSGGNGTKFDHLYVNGTQRGIVANTGMSLTNSYLDNFINHSSNHAQAIISSGNVKNVVLYNNILGCHTGNCTSALSMFPEKGSNVNWKITYNRFRGGSYCVYLGNSGTEKPNTNIDFENNQFDTLYGINCGTYGPVASWSKDPSNIWKNNKWYSPCGVKDDRLIKV